jgi:hypothetical protein
LDNGIRVTTGLPGLVKWLAGPNRLRAIPNGATRFYKKISNCPQLLQDTARGRIRRSCLRLPDGTTRLESTSFDARDMSFRDTFHEFSDMGSKSWAQIYFSFFSDDQLNGWGWFDKPHRRHDNTINATKEADVGFGRTEAVVYENLMSAPYGEGSFFSQIKHVTEELTTEYDVDEKLFQEICTRIAESKYRGFLPPDAFTLEFLEELFEWVEGLEWMNGGGNMGSTTKMARWQQWLRRLKQVLPGIGPLLLVLMYMALHKKWYSSLDQSPFNPSYTGGIAVPAEEGQGVAAEDVLPDNAEPDQRGVKKSSSHIDRLFATSRNRVHLVLRLLCSRTTVALWEFFVAAGDSTLEAHGTNIQNLHTPGGVFEENKRWAFGHSHEVAAETFRVVDDADLAVRMGLHINEDNQDAQYLDDPVFSDAHATEVSKACRAFTRCLAAKEIQLGRTMSDTLPGKFAAVTLLRRAQLQPQGNHARTFRLNSYSELIFVFIHTFRRNAK